MIGQQVSAAVLAGGESRRFGTDKALVPLPGGTTPMLGVIVHALRQVSPDVSIIAPENREYAQFGVPVVSETHPGQGPLGAVEMALRRATHDTCIVVACDLPFLSPVLLRWMVEMDFSEDALVPVVAATAHAGSTGPSFRPQPLHAIYRRSCLDQTRRLLDAGERRLGRLLDLVDVRYLDDAEIRPFDPDLRSFINLNSMEEWAAAQHLEP